MVFLFSIITDKKEGGFLTREERFKKSLLDYTCELIKKLYKGELEIAELENVLFKRVNYYKVNFVCREAYDYSVAFAPEYFEHQHYQYQNTDRGGKIILFTDTYDILSLTKFIEDNHQVLEVSDKLKYRDNSLMSVSEVFMIGFAYYYRKDGNVKAAIKKVGKIIKDGTIRVNEYFLEEDLINYLYKKEMES